MAIGVLSHWRGCRRLAALVLGAVLLAASLASADQITKKDGTVVTGTVNGVSDGQISFTQGTARTVIYLTDIKSVEMPPPAELTKLSGAEPAQVAATLGPIVKMYAGLPADWVLDAMGQLADADDALKQPEKAAAIYAQIGQLYAGTPYEKVAVVGQAKASLQAGQADAALAAVKPLVDEANQNIAPSPAQGRLFGGAFLVYGQVLEQQKQYPQALEAFLTVKTMFYQNPSLLAEADAQAKALLAAHPGVSVD